MFKIIIFFSLAIPTFAHAYLGPALGGGAVVATVGLIISIFALIFGILWFPIKRYLKKRRNVQQEKK